MKKSIIAAALLGMFNLVALDDGVVSDAYAQAKESVKKGRTIGIVTAKGDPAKRQYFIEVKADGEERGRKYVPRWIGGVPAQGGGFDKAMLKTFAALEIGSRVEVNWLYEERLRAVKVTVVKAPPKK